VECSLIVGLLLWSFTEKNKLRRVRGGVFGRGFPPFKKRVKPSIEIDGLGQFPTLEDDELESRSNDSGSLRDKITDRMESILTALDNFTTPSVKVVIPARFEK